MQPFQTALALSLLAHSVVVGGLLVLRGDVSRPMQPVVIDFMMGDVSPGIDMSSRTHGGVETMDRDLAPPAEIRQKTTHGVMKTHPCKKQVVVRKKHEAKTTVIPLENMSGSGNRTAVGASDSVNGVGNNGIKVGSSQDMPELSPDERYVREHFAYIRDLVRKKLKYPRAAVSMGLAGKVGVSFTVLENGELADLEVSRSSGARILDIDAVETVKRAAPFPPPPVTARIVIPVEYILE